MFSSIWQKSALHRTLCVCSVYNIRNGTFSDRFWGSRSFVFYSIFNLITIIIFYHKVHRWAGFLRYCLLVEYCVILPSGLTFFIYADFWAQALPGSFLWFYKTLRTAILGNDRSHMYVSTQTVRCWKEIFSHMSAWLPTVCYSQNIHALCDSCLIFFG